MLVELIGLPGAGKSTLAAHVNAERGWPIKRLPRRSISARSVLAHTFDVILFGLLEPRTSCAMAREILLRNVSARQAIKLAVLYSETLPPQKRSFVEISDQWFVQETWSVVNKSGIGYRTKSALMNAVSSYLRREIALVVLDIPVSTASRRVFERVGGASAYDGLDSADTTLLAFERDHDLFSDWLSGVLGTTNKVLRVDGCRSVDDISREIYSSVQALVEKGA